MDGRYVHQTGFFDPDKTQEMAVTVIGCGGIGACVLPLLVTMGFTKFVLWDADSVEEHNVSTNLIYRLADIGRPKVERSAEYLEEFGAKEVIAHQEAYGGQLPLSGLVISGVDSMAARENIWPHVEFNDEVSLYLDGRIGGLHMTLLAVEPFNLEHIEKYQKHLFPDSKAAPLPCTARTIVYPAVALATHMANILAGWSRGEKMPFRIDFNFGPGLFFEVVN